MRKRVIVLTILTLSLGLFAQPISIFAEDDIAPPSAPTSVKISDVWGNGTVYNVEWTNPAESDFDHVNIYVSETIGQLGSLRSSSADKVSEAALLTGFTSGKIYYFTLRSVDTSGNESKNTDYYIVGSKPDLYIDNISVSPDAPNINENLTFTIKIVNQGSATANFLNPTRLQTMIPSGCTFVSSDDNSELSLKAGGSWNFTRKYICSSAGEKSFRFTVDPNNEVDESNEENNSVTKMVTIGGKCTDSDGGNNIYVKGTTFGYDSYGGTSAYKTYEDACDGTGRVKEFICSYQNDPTGGYGYVSMSNEICLNGCSNGACIQATSSKPDLTVSDITFSNDNFYVKYCNNGQGTSSNKFSIKLSTPNCNTCSIVISNTTGYNVPSPGVCATSEAVGKGWFNVGNLAETQMTATVDSGAQVDESNESNNNLTKTITISANNQKCTDSDDGKNYYTKGSIITYNNITQTDYCAEEKYLKEYYCTDSQEGAMVTYTCPSGCKDGACLKTSTTCTTEYSPVCGKDGKTYSNKCNLEKAGVGLAYEGECKKGCTNEYAPVCGIDGNSYGNKCLLEQANTKLNYYGKCRVDCVAVKLFTDQPTKDKYWEKLGTDPKVEPDILKYKIQWFNGGWSDWYYPGYGDLDWKTNDNGTKRLVWSYFTDHTHEYLKCVKEDKLCTTDYNPVCGKDGKTYSNKCNLEKDGVQLDYYGKCQETACRISAVCEAGYLPKNTGEKDSSGCPIMKCVSKDGTSEINNLRQEILDLKKEIIRIKQEFLNREKNLVQKIDEALSRRLKGRILLQVEEKGEAWYVNPADEQKHYLGRPSDAFSIMHQLGLGITNADLEKIDVGVTDQANQKDTDGDGLSDALEEGLGTDMNKADTDGDGYNDLVEVTAGYNPKGAGKRIINQGLVSQVLGRIMLQVEDKGQAWYLNPSDNKRYYLGRPADAFNIMRGKGLGITNDNLRKIEVGETAN